MSQAAPKNPLGAAEPARNILLTLALQIAEHHGRPAVRGQAVDLSESVGVRRKQDAYRPDPSHSGSIDGVTEGILNRVTDVIPDR